MLEIWLPKRSLEEAVQRRNHWDAKLHLLECKVTPIMVQRYKNHDASPNIFGPKRAVLQNCIIIQFECIFMQVWDLLLSLNVKRMAYYLWYFHKWIFSEFWQQSKCKSSMCSRYITSMKLRCTLLKMMMPSRSIATDASAL